MFMTQWWGPHTTYRTVSRRLPWILDHQLFFLQLCWVKIGCALDKNFRKLDKFFEKLTRKAKTCQVSDVKFLHALKAHNPLWDGQFVSSVRIQDAQPRLLKILDALGSSKECSGPKWNPCFLVSEPRACFVGIAAVVEECWEWFCGWQAMHGQSEKLDFSSEMAEKLRDDQL